MRTLLKLAAMEEAQYDMLDRELGVPIYCFYSGGVPTAERLVYDSMSMIRGSEPRLETGDGDGTVNLRSLEACRRWMDVQQRHPVNVTYYPGVEHKALLHHHDLISDILSVTERVQ